jgi:hypothetical protein
MEKVIVGVFETCDSAEQAREALLVAGFERSRVQLSALEDEAGAVKGNFTVGDHTGEQDDPVYERKFAHPRVRPDCMLTVTARDEADAVRATDILLLYGAIDPDRSAPA